MKFSAIWLTASVLWAVLVFSEGHPAALVATNDDQFDGKSSSHSSHLLKKEHKANSDQESVMDTLFSPEATSSVDRMASSFVKLAGGVVDDLGNFMVDTIDELPKAIRLVSEAVGKAVQTKREKVVIMVKGTPLEDDINRAKEASERITSAVQQSQFQTNLQKLEDSFASLVGKFIGATSKNADKLSSALTSGFKSIAGVKEAENELKILSRSHKENEISLGKSAP